MKKQQEFGYVLRYYLPIKPYFDEDYTEKRFQELLALCKETKMKAVMFFVALHPDTYHMPDTVEQARAAVAQMKPYIERLRKAGIGYQLNFQNIIGGGTLGEDFSNTYGWELLVDQKGRVSRGCGCPIGKKFRENTAERLRIWAETKPDVLWIDDDFRMSNHDTPRFAALDGEPPYADYYCFCDEHIRLFNERVGGNYTRETLVAEILEAGEPTQLRQQYMDFLHETMTETASWIEQTVHGASPATRLALMTSNPDVHTAEGRKWGEFLSALCGEYPPILRPFFGSYGEFVPRDFVRAYQMLAQSIAHVREDWGNGVEYLPEVENGRYTVWTKSAAATTYQLSLAAFSGCKDITMVLYDLEGGAFADEPRYSKMLKEQKPFLDKLAGLDLLNAQNLGVTIPISCEGGRNYALRDGEDYAVLAGRDRYVENYLLKIGIPCRYRSVKELGGDEIVALDGYTANFLSDDELKRVMQGKVFLEGQAAKVLCEKGLGEYIGVRATTKQRFDANAEIFQTKKRADGTYIRIPARIPTNCWYALDLMEDTERITQFASSQGRIFAGLTRFTNALGGTVLIYPAEKDWSSFFNHQRVALFKDLFGELCGDLPRVDCGCYSCVVAKRKADGTTYYYVANLAGDNVERMVINGKTVKERLQIYQAVVYEEKNGRLKKVGKTKK